MNIKKINSGIPIGDVIYTSGMEKELSAVLNEKQGAYLAEQGAVEIEIKTDNKEADQKEVKKGK